MLYEITVPRFIKGLQNLNHVLDKAAAHADAKKFDSSVYLQSRLAPDMFPFTKQIQIACDTAKLAASRLTGKEAPAHADDEKTLAELRTRIDQVINYLKTFSERDFAGADEKKITTPRWDGKWLNGKDFVFHHAIPNFYFHTSIAYAILRHNGVDIGKKDYLGALPFQN